jgi:hypothetical protein
MAHLMPTRARSRAVLARPRASIELAAQVGLVLSIALALVLRLGGLPERLEVGLQGDEYKYVLATAVELDEPVDYRNPSLFRHLLGAERWLLDRLQPPGATARESLARRLLLARLTVALFGVATVPLMFVVGRRLFGPLAGAVAAGLLAASLLHVSLSQVALNDAPAAFFMVAALVPASALLRGCPKGDGSARRWGLFFLAGLAAGLATATKYNFGIVLVVPLGVGLLEGGAAARWRAGLVGSGLALIGAALGLLVGMPELVGSLGSVRDGIAAQAALGDRRWPGQSADPVLLLYAWALLLACGPFGLLAALVGLTRPGWRRGSSDQRPTADWLIMAACPALYLAFMASKELFFARFALPLVPFVCLYAGAGLDWLAHSGGRRTALLALAGLLVLAGPLALSGRLLWLATQTDTRVQAERWLLDTIPAGTKVAAQSYSLPSWGDASRPRQVFDLTAFTALSEPRQLSQLICAGNRIVLTSSFRSDRQRTVGRPGAPTGYDLLASEGQLLATFRPVAGDNPPPFDPDDVGLPFWHLLDYARPGPSISAYALPPEACAEGSQPPR